MKEEEKSSKNDKSENPTTLFSEETYFQRLKRFTQMVDWRHAFTTNKQLEAAKEAVHEEEKGGKKATNLAKKRVDTCVHPETKENIFFPLRTSFIVPANTTLDCLMLLASRSGYPAAIVSSQVLNQSYNALHYHAYRNGTSHNESTQKRITAFALATTSSVIAALSINRFTKIRPNRLLRVCGPFLAVSIADILNLGTMRSIEYTRGIRAYHPDTKAPLKTLPRSRRLGALAVAQSIATRVLAAMPILTIPPLIIQALDKRINHPFYTRFFRYPLLALFVASMIQISVPTTFALFKQYGQVDVQWLEKPYQESGLKRVLYNKGI
eukprot:CAMPEP_0201544700 /NCGR_PEP_ID=MMETSP0173_2-20130828/1320_1 /ASSEMBLY_ACC=CAM_ASM_000268 /TAXON_ID=218659 /ORGANISM="Vexillifera sp., Strain DIVA3 564/2" /LENGTH=323 /DNA_ID=CAMNT_0047952915 /DNA_START=3 /DNA_END=974 /DNA_ORIENTATION=-